MEDANMQRNVKEMKAIVEEFRGKPVSNEALKSFCERHGYAVIGVGEYSDWLFAYEHDERLVKIMPEIFTALSKWKYPGGFLNENDAKEITKHNNAVEEEICEIMEKGGILYQEIDIFTKNVGEALHALLVNAGVRCSNMCAAVFAHTTKQKYGQTLPLSVLAEAHRREIEKVVQ